MSEDIKDCRGAPGELRPSEPQVGTLVDRLLAIGRDCAKRLGPEFCAHDHDAALYGEEGLPR
jgi:hypothetical protein